MAGRQSDGIHSRYHNITPAKEYAVPGFGTNDVVMRPGAFNGGMHGQSMAPQLQALVMPQWPSMLSSQSHANHQPVYPAPVQPIQPISMGALHTSVSATSTGSATTPRRTLTDLDRKRMCEYAEEHPNSNQSEIGGSCTSTERRTLF